MLAAAGVSCLKGDGVALRASVGLLALNGSVFIALSSHSFPLKVNYILLLVVVIFLVMFHFRGVFDGLWVNVARGLVVAIAALIAGLKLPEHLPPSVPSESHSRLYVLGDSISGGVGFPGEQTWHECLAERHGVEVVAYCVGGARVETMFFDAGRIGQDDSPVLLQIGGNDLLHRTPLAKYEKDLDKLMGMVCRPGRKVLMFGLPLPFFNAEFGEIQKRVSRKHGVILIPRRYFSGMLSGSANTVDGLHLSNRGHSRMADTTWGILKPFFESNVHSAAEDFGMPPIKFDMKLLDRAKHFGLF